MGWPFEFFIFQNSFEREVLFLYFSVLKDCLWLAYLDLNFVTERPMYFFVMLFGKFDDMVAS